MSCWMIAAGVLSFGLMALSDWLGAVKKIPGAGAVFAAACLVLAGASGGLLLETGAGSGRSAPVFWCAAAGMLALLVYTVFVAPGSGKPREDGKLPLVDTGVYALCRHPGVLWLVGVYFFIWCACGGAAWLAAFLLFSAADALYVLWQDRAVFPISIQSYAEYQKSTPFLIPDRNSVRNCLRSSRFLAALKNRGRRNGK